MPEMRTELLTERHFSGIKLLLVFRRLGISVDIVAAGCFYAVLISDARFLSDASK